MTENYLHGKITASAPALRPHIRFVAVALAALLLTATVILALTQSTLLTGALTSASALVQGPLIEGPLVDLGSLLSENQLGQFQQ